MRKRRFIELVVAGLLSANPVCAAPFEFTLEPNISVKLDYSPALHADPEADGRQVAEKIWNFHCKHQEFRKSCKSDMHRVISITMRWKDCSAFVYAPSSDHPQSSVEGVYQCYTDLKGNQFIGAPPPDGGPP